MVSTAHVSPPFHQKCEIKLELSLVSELAPNGDAHDEYKDASAAINTSISSFTITATVDPVAACEEKDQKLMLSPIAIPVTSAGEILHWTYEISGNITSTPIARKVEFASKIPRPKSGALATGRLGLTQTIFGPPVRKCAGARVTLPVGSSVSTARDRAFSTDSIRVRTRRR